MGEVDDFVDDDFLLMSTKVSLSDEEEWSRFFQAFQREVDGVVSVLLRGICVCVCCLFGSDFWGLLLCLTWIQDCCLIIIWERHN